LFFYQLLKLISLMAKVIIICNFFCRSHIWLFSHIHSNQREFLSRKTHIQDININ